MAHSFLRKILPNSTAVGQFAKFCSLQLTAVQCGLPFVSKLSSILLKNFSF